MRTKYIFSLFFFSGLITVTACKKSEFLNAKPNANLNVPTTLDDFQALMDNYNTINQTPGLGDMSSDNYYYSFEDWQAQGIVEQNCYIWAKDIFEGNGNVSDWNLSYQQVLVANIVLEGLVKMSTSGIDNDSYNTIKGEAYFIRANAFFNLSQIFAAPYDSSNASSTPGIPIRLNSDVDRNENRSSIAFTYEQIIGDLKSAAALISQKTPTTNINRPVKAAAYGLLSKVFLSMRAYDKAGKYADSCLQLYSSLIDFNNLSTSSRIPFGRNNAETIYQSYQVSLYSVDGSNGVAQVDSSLYNSYDSTDLRREIFFRLNGLGKLILKGTYSGTYFLFSGIAVNEMYLNRAESYARLRNIPAAMDDLNALLLNRYLTGTYIPKSAASSAEALDLILSERRKELPFSDTRWTDLRRLNKEGWGISLTRVLNSHEYELPPNSNLYTLPIPPDEAGLSNIEQNSRN